MYAYYCLHRLKWRPRKFVNLPLKEKALVIAMIDERIKQERRQEAELKRQRR